MTRHHRELRFVFAGVGTKGDVLPLLALAEELKRRGHACDVLANESFEDLAGSKGLGFRGVTTEQANNLVGHEENLEFHIMPSYAPTIRYFEEQRRKGAQLVVVNLDEFSASNLMCELFALPLCRAHLAPKRIKSLLAPPWPAQRYLGGPFGATFRKFTLPRSYAALERAPGFLSRLNPYRASLGLPPIGSTLEIDRNVTERLCLFPDWFCSPAPDWPTPTRVVGFPLPPAFSALPQEVVAFAEQQGRPIVFTPGTGVQDVADFFRDAKACCDALGRPGLFLSRCLTREQQDFGPSVLTWDYLELASVLPLAELLVHHGGIGTTARAFQAGVAQLVRPVAYDQSDNGHRVRTLGAGGMLEAEDYSLEAFIHMARRLLSDPDVARSVRECRNSISRAEGVTRGADALERLAANAWRSRPEILDDWRRSHSSSPVVSLGPPALD